MSDSETSPDHDQLARLRRSVSGWNRWRQEDQEKIKINLRGADLRGADLRGADLSEADLSEANLRGADLGEADLFKAYLRGANLSKADLRGAYLFKTNLIEANLSETDLIGANLSEADLFKANLIGANLSETDLIGANLSETDLIGANLRGANLSKADLIGANLSRPGLVSGSKFGQIVEETFLRDVGGVIGGPEVFAEAIFAGSLLGDLPFYEKLKAILGSGKKEVQVKKRPDEIEPLTLYFDLATMTPEDCARAIQIIEECYGSPLKIIGHKLLPPGTQSQILLKRKAA